MSDKRIDETWWLSCRKMTVCVGVKSGVIVDTPPIVSKFRGQSILNLKEWFRSFGGYREQLFIEPGE